jgi:hypothetical protein
MSRVFIENNTNPERLINIICSWIITCMPGLTVNLLNLQHLAGIIEK